MTDRTKIARRQFRNIRIVDLVHYRLPLAGFLSILHRISGALIFLLLPFILLLLDKSLMSETSYEDFRALLSHWFVKLIVLALTWSYLHHFFAGIRHLFMDIHVGVNKDTTGKTAVVVFALSLPLTVIVALKLYGAF